MPEKPHNFWEELKRRKVIGVIIAYAAVGFAIIELVDIITEPLTLPDWTLTLVIVLVAIGFPIVVIFAWIFDVSSKGIKRTEPLITDIQEKGDQLEYKSNFLAGNSIAVLPFKDMSPEKDQEYFCDGIAEEIINALAYVSSLKVIARTSAFAFKNQNIDMREISRKLSVEMLVEGSIRKAGNRLRITAQLVKVE